ncbi:hypothetical protein PDE_02483 [Penicillium oxalicum 114-2]|uniref:CENP-V/GFA domain-containing protein n=1 Tax=Penicillium oxalicum (strain 114-2 / CGMCC 5302) TaxID=933388 RepID=S7ZAB7_PENO1|nr:hypothetical protein PDE_02483 [Penicillium oxalicum 114-2]
MAIGSCFCGQIRIKFNGNPLMSGLCHCHDCRKLTGSPYSYSLVIKTAELEVLGNPKEVPKTADSGNDIRNYFCSGCGTPLYGHKIKSDGTPDEITVVRAGIFDDSVLDQCRPQAELYTDSRLKWVEPIEGAEQFDGMMALS